MFLYLLEVRTKVKFQKISDKIPGYTLSFKNNFTHFSCQTQPLYNILVNIANARSYCETLPFCISGGKLNFIYETPKTIDYNLLHEQIPSHFWRSRSFHSIPKNPFFRRKIFTETFNSNHHNCVTQKSHRFASNYANKSTRKKNI